jgi:hypothetical protein
MSDGFNCNQLSDNFILRSKCIFFLNTDIIGVAETQLMGQDVLNLENYTLYGNNRKQIHRNARKGSGGVGFFVKNSLLLDFNISTLYDTLDDIL